MLCMVLLMTASQPLHGWAANGDLKITRKAGETRVSVVFRKVEVTEVMEMLSRHARVSISLGKDIEGEVSINLYDVTVDQAIRIVAESAGYTVETRNGAYMVVKRDEAGKFGVGGLTVTQSFGLRYADATAVSAIVKESLSHFGKVTVLAERGMLVIQDLPDFMERIGRLIRTLDREPTQILIEAKILVVQLTDEYRHGIDWSHAFTYGSPQVPGTNNVGIRQQQIGAGPNARGFVFEWFTPHFTAILDALEDEGRIRTISNPTLLTMENQQAHVIIGSRLGYRVTTTTNQVTTESVEFLESGTILRVTPSIDGSGNVRLQVQPQVSDGQIDPTTNLPTQNTTEVSTTLLIPSGETAFIGGLISRVLTEGRTGVPFLMDIPGLRWLFSNHSQTNTHTETIVLLTPRIVGLGENTHPDSKYRVDHTERVFRQESRDIDTDVDLETTVEPKVDELYRDEQGTRATEPPPAPRPAPAPQTRSAPPEPAPAKTPAMQPAQPMPRNAPPPAQQVRMPPPMPAPEPVAEQAVVDAEIATGPAAKVVRVEPLRAEQVEVRPPANAAGNEARDDEAVRRSRWGGRR